MRVQSAVQAITTSPAQYLFRIYHEPIKTSTAARMVGRDIVADAEEDYVINSYELNFNDHLFSIPPDTQTIINMANQLAYAESLLYVNNSIPFIAVFLVQPNKGIDESTPVTVLHPLGSNILRDRYKDIATRRVSHMTPRADPFYIAPDGYVGGYVEEPGFRSFDLTARVPESYIADPFIVLDVARDCVTGKPSKQHFKGVLGRDDYFQDENGNFVLNTNGSLYLTRFPWFQATLESMPYTHSGWTVNRDGSIKHGRQKLTRRTANLAIDSAIARRQFMRRNYALQKVYETWYKTAVQCQEWLHWLEIEGWPDRRALAIWESDTEFVTFQKCDAGWMRKICQNLIWFLNVQAIANGSNSLVAWYPDTDELSQLTEYKRIVSYLSNGGTTVNTYAQVEGSQNWKVVLGMVDILGVVIKAVHDYAQAVGTLAYSQAAHGFRVGVIQATEYAQAFNQFAAAYTKLQGEVHALQCLMMTWQFTFQPYESAKFNQPFDWAKTDKPKDVIYRDRERYWREANEGITAAHIEGRVTWDYPIFAPFRVWDVDVAPFQVSPALILAQIAADKAALQAQQDAITLQRQDYQQQQQQQGAAHVTAIQADLAANGGANPYDPWDYRNWRNKKWWVTSIPPSKVPVFLLNAANTPDEIETIGTVLHLPKKVITGVKRFEPLIIGVKELICPQTAFRDVIKSKQFRRLIKAVATDVFKEAVDHYEDDAKKDVIIGLAGPQPGYAPRVFWPPS